MAFLEIKNLHVALEDGTEIVKGVDLSVDLNEKHAIMGPNGSGKSTLAYALMGHPAYEITEGEILLDGENIVEAGADERAQKGLFLAFQYPHAIPGVTVTSFLRSAINAIRKARAGGKDDPIPVKEFRTEILAAMERLKVPRELASRYLNDGFSGGEKKRVEILQMALLQPKIAILDETDSGLDIDALRIVANGVNELVSAEMGALVITHYQRILNYVTPDHVHVFVGGKIVAERRPGARAQARGRGLRCLHPEGRGGGGMSASETDVVKGIRSEYKYGFSNSDEAENYFFKSGRGLSHEIVEAIAEHKKEPDWMRKFRHKSLDYFLARPLPDLGRQRRRDRLREHLLLHQADREAGVTLGGPAGRHPRHLGQAGHPRGGEEVPRRGRRPVRVGGRLPQAPGRPRGEGRHLPRHGLGAPRARGHRQAVHGDDHPAERQQVRGSELGRLVGRARSSTCRPASRSSCRSRPTSASTRRTWASSSAR